MPKTESELEAVLGEYLPKVRRYLTRLAGADEAEDLTQETVLKVTRAFNDFDRRSKLSTWIYRIATNTAVDRLRSSSYRRTQAMASEAELAAEDQSLFRTGKVLSTDQQVIEQEMNRCIREFVERLPEQYRTVLVLSEFERLKNQEIASVLGITLDTVKIRLHRARAGLRRELERGCSFYRTDGKDGRDGGQLACEPTGDRTATRPDRSR